MGWQIEDRSRETRLRRMAARQGLTLQKARPRAIMSEAGDDEASYRLTDDATGETVYGGALRGRTADEVERYLRRSHR